MAAGCSVGHTVQCSWLLYLWVFLPRWCFCCEADCIIYLYAKLNPRLGLTYLSFRIAKLAVFPTVSFIRQANFSISSFHPSASFPDCLLIPLFSLFLSSPRYTACHSHFCCYDESVGAKAEYCAFQTTTKDRKMKAGKIVVMMVTSRRRNTKAKWGEASWRQQEVKETTGGGKKMLKRNKVEMRCKCVEEVWNTFLIVKVKDEVLVDLFVKSEWGVRITAVSLLTRC